MAGKNLERVARTVYGAQKGIELPLNAEPAAVRWLNSLRQDENQQKARLRLIARRAVVIQKKQKQAEERLMRALARELRASEAVAVEEGG
jgi:outer membrane PBP1 activator LpoA protein